MDVLPFLFLVGLAVVGGVIAVAADTLGKKLGKKRLSFMGLRPRHTAMLGTFVLGLFISLFTIVLVAGLSRDVRQWILQGRNAIVQRDQAIQQRNSEQQGLNEAQQRYSVVRAEIPILERRIKETQQRVTQGDAKLAAQHTQYLAQQARLADLDARRQSLETKLVQTNLQIKVKDAQIKQVQVSLQKNMRLLASNRRMLSTAVAQLNSSKMQGLALDQQNEKLSAQIDSQKQDLASLQADKESLESKRAALSNEVTDMAGRLAQEESVLFQAHQDEVVLENTIAEAKGYLDGPFMTSRSQPMIYGSGQEVARRPVDSHLTRAQAQDAVESVLREARDEASARGAKENARYKVADIMSHTGDDPSQQISPEQYKAAVVDQLIDKAQDQVLIATSSLNAFKGEVVSLEIEVRPNAMAFHRGEVVASSNIDGSRSETEISNDIAQLISVRVRDKAKERKMIPLPNGRFGSDSLSEDDLFRTIQNIKSVGRYCRVQAVALDDTRVADVLKLDLHIR